MLVLLYLMSTLYHALRPPRAKKVFRILDHSAIFLLIAGTYTPLCLGPLKGPWGWSLFGIVWGLAVMGIVFKATLFHHWAWLSTATYLLMGWIALIAIVPLMRTLSPAGLAWLFGGGLSLGHLMYETGLAAAVGRALVRVSGAQDVWALTAVAIVAGILLSETSSNTASASVVIPVMIAVAAGLGVSPVPPALGAALGASFGFMLPVSTPPNAIVYGSGLVPLREMVRSGIVLDILGALLIWLGLRVLAPLAGLV